jgi:Ca2+-binding RTX toxin-like protein
MPTLVAPMSNRENYAVSPDGTRIYVAGNDGVLRVYNAVTGSLLFSWNVGVDLEAITISRDGRYAIITDRVPISTSQSSNWTENVTVVGLYQVDLRTGATQTYRYEMRGSDYGFADVAFADDNTVIISGDILPGWSGWAPLYRLDLNTSSFTRHGSYYAGLGTAASLTQAAQPGNVLLGQLGLSSAEYSAIRPDGTSAGSNGIYQNGVQGYAGGVEAFFGSGTSGRVAIVTGGGLYLYNGSFGFIGDLAELYPNLGNSPAITFSHDGRVLYAVDAVTDEVLAIAMDDYFVIQRITLGAYDYPVQQWGSELNLTPDGLSFFIATTQGVLRLERPTANVRSDGDDILTGTAGADDMSGGLGNDTLFGLAGADLLSGGLGTDNLHGGTGNDIYLVNSQNDLVFEDAGAGTDAVLSSSNFYLYANVENLTLESGSGNIFGVGNDLNNIINGNEGANLIIAGGGADTVNGAAGNDLIFGGDGNDQLRGDEGVDYIVGGLGLDTLDGGAGADEIYGEDGDDILSGGTTFDTDILVGGAGNDSLYGDSGRGDYDRLYGNAGNDSFYVDTPADLVFEQANEGIDTVYANINGAGFYLYDNIENLVLEGSTPFGVGNALNNNITGNSGSNWLLGGAGNDTLNGMGGNDVLFGEAGNDVFVFGAGSGADVIGDFNRGQDRIDLSAFGLSFAQWQASFVQNGNDGAINLGNGNLIVLHGVTMSQLTAADFVLAPVSEGAPKAEVDVSGAFVTDGQLNSVDAMAVADHSLQRWQPVYGDLII